MNKQQEHLYGELELLGMNRNRGPEHEAAFQKCLNDLHTMKINKHEDAEEQAGPSPEQWTQIIKALQDIAANPAVIHMPSQLEIVKMPVRELKTVVLRDERNRATGTRTTEKDKE